MGNITGDWDWTPKLQVTGEDVVFTATVTTSSGSIVKYEWQFGADAPVIDVGLNAEYEYQFADAGTYAVRCRVTDSEDAVKVSPFKDVVITKKYRIHGQWITKPYRAWAIVDEYSAGNQRTGETWRMPFDTLTLDYDEVVERFLPLIQNPEQPPEQAIMDEIEDRLHEALKE